MPKAPSFGNYFFDIASNYICYYIFTTKQMFRCRKIHAVYQEKLHDSKYNNEALFSFLKGAVL
jgi:hypothetical protein